MGENIKIATVLGTRPEIIKTSSLIEAINKKYNHVFIHTGQHYDEVLDKKILEDLDLPEPNYRLSTGSGNFGTQFSEQVKKIFEVIEKEKPRAVLVQGDTNSAFSGALIAARLKIPVFHVEAGCRSFYKHSPEEQNRIMIDHISTLYFCTDESAKKHLEKEGIIKNCHITGGTAIDALLRTEKIVDESILSEFNLKKDMYAVVTLHRAENTENIDEMKSRINFINELAEKLQVVFPCHPRTKKYFEINKIKLSSKIKLLDPLSYKPFVGLLKFCRFIASDSGGIQEEAAFLNRPCLILRNETEWMRLVEIKKNYLLNGSKSDLDLVEKLINDENFYNENRSIKPSFLNSGATDIIMKLIDDFFSKRS